MDNRFVQACFDLHCDYQGLAPVYRVLLNGELFAEREWRWPDAYLTEQLQISAPPGDYQLEIVQVSPAQARFRVEKQLVVHGPADWVDRHTLRIRDK
jgi:hypothetical protein